MILHQLRISEVFFDSCGKIESIDISTFNTSSVTNMKHMFFHCKSLKIIVFPENLDVSKVNTMEAMFSHCFSLIALNLSNFKLKSNTNITYMFNDCYNLKYLDFSNCPPINISEMKHTFFNLSSLIYLNIPSLDIFNDEKMTNSFGNLNSYVRICSNQSNLENYLTKEKLNYDCSAVCFYENIKIDFEYNECLTSCKENKYDYEYLNICYHQCPDYTHAIQKNISDDALICLDKNPEGYYLDIDGFYKECFETCKFCYGPGTELDHNCSICKNNLTFFNDSFYKNNCYEICPYYYYYDDNYAYHCTNKCEGDNDKLKVNSNKCVNNCEKESKYKYEYNKICYEECNDEIDTQKEEHCFDTKIY